VSVRSLSPHTHRFVGHERITFRRDVGTQSTPRTHHHAAIFQGYLLHLFPTQRFLTSREIPSFLSPLPRSRFYQPTPLW
jgi:hypothetical protein